MLHHFLQRGILPEKIINRPLADKAFFIASARLALDEEREKMKALAGG